MRVDLTINDVGKTWQFGNEQVWAVKSNGKSYSFYSQHKPVIGSFIPCMVEERQGATKEGKAITYRDARPIPKEELARMDDNVPQFQTPSKQAEKPPESPQDTLFRRIPHKSEPGVYMYEPAPETPEWAKPGPKPTLTGDLYLMGRYLDVLLNHPKINLANEVNWLGGFASVIATGLRDYHDGKLTVELSLIPDDVVAAYQAAKDGQWPTN